MISELERELGRTNVRVGGTIDSVVNTRVMYSGVNKPLQQNTQQPPIQPNNTSMSRPVEIKPMQPKNPYGSRGFQENKLIDKELGNVTSYSKIDSKGFREEITYNRPLENHRNKTTGYVNRINLDDL